MELLTVKETAEKLKLSEAVIRKLLREGLIPGTKVAREWRVPDEILMQTILECEDIE